MRILYLTADPGVPVLGTKGASIHVRELTRALAEGGAEVTIASPRIGDEGGVRDWGGSLLQISPVLPKQHLRPETLTAAIDAQATDVELAARGARADVIYERFSLFSTAGVRAAAALGIPHLLEVNAPLRDEARRFRVLPHADIAEAAERHVFAGSDVILAVSQPLADWIHRTGCTTPVTVLENAVDPARFGSAEARPVDRFVAGFAGSLKPWHGIEVLLAACAIAMREQPTLHLEIVGGGPMSVAIDRADLPPDRVIQHGVVDHARAIRLIGGWHAGLAPYHDLPGFYFSPLKVLEYMASEVCPIASDLGQIHTLLGGGERGVLVPAGDRAALASALASMVADPAAAARKAAAARAYVIATHTWRGNAARVIDLAGRVPRRRAA
ncbi:MAG TPA: glycosyltransferase family 4 protein [Gaiellales bacterium]|nr:glycosyltransferase family 4 protein [Gaiellales bacterium]